MRSSKIAAAVLSLLALVCAATRAEAQPQCPIIIPEAPVVVAPDQPDVPERSTVGIINALCDVTLNFVNCGFAPTRIEIICDTNGDGVGELLIPLADIRHVNRNLVRATVPRLGEQLPGTAFPLACCGGSASVVLSRTVGTGDDNVFGEFTQKITCTLDLGLRAPVVISASPSSGDCALGQNILVVGSCFVQADGTPNVDRVFAVNIADPEEVIEASKIVLLNPNVIDAFFQLGAANRGKTYLIFASGPNGTSRNLTELPEGAAPDCPLGNEQGVQVTFTCASNPPADSTTPISVPVINGCKLTRKASGAFALTINASANGLRQNSQITVGGRAPNKVKLKGPIPGTDSFAKAVVQGGICAGLPGVINVTTDGRPSLPFQCNETCPAQ